MTLITAFSVAGCPVLFGDLLISAQGSTGRAVAVPALGDVGELANGWKVSGLRQKICVLSPDLALGWAGDFLGARYAIGELHRRAATESLTAEKVLAYLEGETELHARPVSFIGLTQEGPTRIQFQFRASRFESASLGIVDVDGSGSSALREYSDLLQGTEPTSTGPLNAAFQAAAHALMLGGLLLNTEFHGQGASTILKLFGGGYEIAIYTDTGLAKPEVTHVLWQADLDGSQQLIPRLVVKQQYVGNVLLVRSARVDATPSDGIPVVGAEQRHIILPMFDVSGSFRLQDLFATPMPLQSRLLSHCIAGFRDAKMVGACSMVQFYGAISECGVTFEESDGEIAFRIRDDVMTQIRGGLQQLID